jgi:hypothetical protein
VLSAFGPSISQGNKKSGPRYRNPLSKLASELKLRAIYAFGAGSARGIGWRGRNCPDYLG